MGLKKGKITMDHATQELNAVYIIDTGDEQKRLRHICQMLKGDLRPLPIKQVEFTIKITYDVKKTRRAKTQ